MSAWTELAAGLSTYLLNYLLHSTLFLGATWLAVRWRWVRAAAAEDVLWKTALVSGIFTALIPTLGIRNVSLRLPLPTLAAAEAPAADPAPLFAATDEFPRAQSERQPQKQVSEAPSLAVVETARPLRAVPTARVEPLPVPAPVETPTAASKEPLAATMPAWIAEHWKLGLLAGWSLIAVVGLLRLRHLRSRLERGLAGRSPVSDESLLATFGRLLGLGRVRRPVQLTQSWWLPGPITMSKREVCIPERVLADLSRKKQEVMLAHEVAHLVRRDPQWLRACSVIEALFFFQPLNRLGRIRMQRAAEFLCDDWAAQRTGRGITLAKCLADVAGWLQARRQPRGVPTMAQLDSTLVHRVQRLTGSAAGDDPRAGRRALLLGGLFVAAVSCTGPSVHVDDEQDEPVDARPVAWHAGHEDDGPHMQLASHGDDETIVLNVRDGRVISITVDGRRIALDGDIVLELGDPQPNSQSKGSRSSGSRSRGASPFPEHPPHPEHPQHPDHPDHPPHPEHPAHPQGDWDADSWNEWEQQFEGWAEQWEDWGEQFGAEWESEWENWAEQFESNWEEQGEAWSESMEAWAHELEAQGEQWSEQFDEEWAEQWEAQWEDWAEQFEEHSEEWAEQFDEEWAQHWEEWGEQWAEHSEAWAEEWTEQWEDWAEEHENEFSEHSFGEPSFDEHSHEEWSYGEDYSHHTDREAHRDHDREIQEAEAALQREMQELQREIQQLQQEFQRNVQKRTQDSHRDRSHHDRDFSRRQQEATREFERNAQEMHRELQRAAQAFEREHSNLTHEYERAMQDLMPLAQKDPKRFEREVEDLEDRFEDSLDELEDAYEARQDEYEDLHDQRADEFEEAIEAAEEAYENSIDAWSDSIEAELEGLEEHYENAIEALEERWEQMEDSFGYRDCDHDCEHRCAFGCTHREEPRPEPNGHEPAPEPERAPVTQPGVV